MLIHSFLIPNVIEGKQYLLYDTVIFGKHVFTACGVGIIENGEPVLSSIATETLFALTEYVNDFGGTIRFQEIRTVSRCKGRVKAAIEAARDKEVIFFVCHGSDVYDAAVAALHVKWLTSETEH